MSSNCPPQLHLTLPSNATSFKRSFEQFGFDLESPVSGAEAGGSNSNAGRGLSGGGSGHDGNDRTKRARSASSSSISVESAETSRSSPGGASGSSGATSISGNDLEGDSLSGLSVTRPPSLTVSSNHVSLPPSVFLEPPRLPTPDLQDIEMPDYPSVEASRRSPSPAFPSTISEHEERFRVSLERFNAFDSQISALRQSRSRSPPGAQSPTPPPILPPLVLSSTSEDRDNLSTTVAPFLHPPTESSPPLPESFYSFRLPLSTRSHMLGRDTSMLERSDHHSDGPRVLPHEMHRTASTSALRQRGD